MEEIKINKIKKLSNGNSLTINFVGSVFLKNDENYIKSIDLLDNFLNSDFYNNNLEQNVAIIRTILKSFEEKKLTIVYVNIANMMMESIIYNDKELTYLEETQLANKLSISYDNSRGLNISIDNENKESFEHEFISFVSRGITNIMNHIQVLSNVKSYSLTEEDKKLIELYRLFYNENPDFTQDDINLKMQTMVLILRYFGYDIDNENNSRSYNYYFRANKRGDLPISTTLSVVIKKLFAFGEVTQLDSKFKLNKNDLVNIKMIRKIIDEELLTGDNEINVISNLSKIIYDNHVNWNRDCSQIISEQTLIPLEEVKKNQECIKRLTRKMLF